MDPCGATSWHGDPFLTSLLRASNLYKSMVMRKLQSLRTQKSQTLLTSEPAARSQNPGRGPEELTNSLLQGSFRIRPPVFEALSMMLGRLNMVYMDSHLELNSGDTRQRSFLRSWSSYLFYKSTPDPAGKAPLACMGPHPEGPRTNMGKPQLSARCPSILLG